MLLQYIRSEPASREIVRARGFARRREPLSIRVAGGMRESRRIYRADFVRHGSVVSRIILSASADVIMRHGTIGPRVTSMRIVAIHRLGRGPASQQTTQLLVSVQSSMILVILADGPCRPLTKFDDADGVPHNDVILNDPKPRSIATMHPASVLRLGLILFTRRASTSIR
jgi:hypothetical protein